MPLDIVLFENCETIVTIGAVLSKVTELASNVSVIALIVFPARSFILDTENVRGVFSGSPAAVVGE